MAFPGVRSTPETAAPLSMHKYSPATHVCRPLIEFAVSMAMSSITFVNTVSIKEQRVLVFKAALRSFTTLKRWLHFQIWEVRELHYRHGHSKPGWPGIALLNLW